MEVCFFFSCVVEIGRKTPQLSVYQPTEKAHFVKKPVHKRQEVNNSSVALALSLMGLNPPPTPPLHTTTRLSFLNFMIRTHCGSESLSRAIGAGTFSKPGRVSVSSPQRRHLFICCAFFPYLLPLRLCHADTFARPCKEPAVGARTSAHWGRAVILTLQFRDWRNAAWC